MLDWALFLRGWTSDVVALTDGRIAVPPDVRDRLARAGVTWKSAGSRDWPPAPGGSRRCRSPMARPGGWTVLFVRPPQRQVPVVQSLGLSLDPAGYVKVDEARETSVPGIFAAGDLLTPQQGAIIAAASGTLAAAALNHALTIELAEHRLLP